MDTSHPALEEESHKIPLPAIIVNISKHDLEGDIGKDAGATGLDMAKKVSEILEVPSDDMKKDDEKLEGLQLLSSSSGTKVSAILYSVSDLLSTPFIFCQKLCAIVVFYCTVSKNKGHVRVQS